ncbi:MAG: hypothetical protein ACTSRR_03845 [Candidatus Heimdallarchaeaceae archaeon]
MNFFSYLPYLNRENISWLFKKSEKIDEITDEDFVFRLKKVLNSDTLTSSQKRKIWQISMESLFFNEMHRSFIFTPTSKFPKTTEIKAAISKKLQVIVKEEKIACSPIYVSMMEKTPLHFLISFSLEKATNFEKFLEIPLNRHLVFNIFPEKGFCTFWPLDRDVKLKVALKLINELFADTKEIKVNALLLRKFSTQDQMKRMVISTPPEIAGFSGLDSIEFYGSDVMLGLSGLKRRHDADVEKITRVGPLTDLESDNIRLKAGKGVQVKNYSAIDKLLAVVKT